MANSKKILIAIFVLTIIFIIAGCVNNQTNKSTCDDGICDETENEVNCPEDCNDNQEPTTEKCSIGKEIGVNCPTKDQCSSNEWVDGCCIGGTCSEIPKKYCDALNPCPKGKECYKFEDEEEPICFVGDPCEKCESKQCDVMESYPAQVACKGTPSQEKCGNGVCEQGEDKNNCPQDCKQTTINITRTSGTYMNHNWYIDENHVMYWDGEPYIHYGLSGPRDYKDITKTYEFIDNFASKGIKDYMLWYEGDQESGQWTKEEYNNWIDKTTDYITKKGGTYIFILQPFYAVKADGVWDTAFMNRDDVKQDILNEFNRFKPLVTKEGLRGLGFSSEINTNAGKTAIKAPKQESGFEDFKEMLNFYAKSMKDTYGDLPVFFRMGEHHNYIPFLYAMRGDYIDGVIAEYNQFSLNDVKDQMTKSPYIEYFNSFDKTKFYWVNLQVNFETTLTWVPYVSYDVMWQHHKIAVDNGATGSSLDMSDYDWVLNNCQCGTLEDTWKWYGQFKNQFKNLVLDNAGHNKFIIGDYAPKQVSYTYKTSKMSFDEITSIIKSSESYKEITNNYPCLQLLASEPPLFKKSKGTWSTSLIHKDTGKEFYCFEVDDAGNIVRNCAELEKEAISLGYTYTIKDELEQHIQDNGCSGDNSNDSQSCTVGPETGVKCDSADKCSSGEWVNGCCIGGQCTP